MPKAHYPIRTTNRWFNHTVVIVKRKVPSIKDQESKNCNVHTRMSPTIGIRSTNDTDMIPGRAQNSRYLFFYDNHLAHNDPKDSPHTALNTSLISKTLKYEI